MGLHKRKFDRKSAEGNRGDISARIIVIVVVDIITKRVDLLRTLTGEIPWKLE